MKQDRIRTYSEMIKLPTFRERFEYLKLSGKTGERTFGGERWLNQQFYRDEIWKKLRREIILRDLGCDLAVDDPDHEITGMIYVHHMNPVDTTDILERSAYLLDPEFLVCTSLLTHQAIHYSGVDLADRLPAERSPFDTCPWKAEKKEVLL